MQPIIEIRNLSKSFKHLDAVQDLSFEIEQGQVYGLLGQNGAGKSTTMRMMLGLIFPDCGNIMINGTNFTSSSRYLLKHIGAIIERPDMYLFLTGWENLKIFAALSKLKIKDSHLMAVLEQVGLRGREHDKVKAYSQGMKQRLGIAIAMVHEPDLLILDEPTNGLDPQGIAEMRSLIIDLSKVHNKTVLISSHLLFEIEQIATHMLIMHKGRKIAGGKVSDLLNPEETIVDIAVTPNPDLYSQINLSAWFKHFVDADNDKLSFKINKTITPALIKWLVENGAGIQEVKMKHSLEAYFLSLTND